MSNDCALTLNTLLGFCTWLGTTGVSRVVFPSLRRGLTADSVTNYDNPIALGVAHWPYTFTPIATACEFDFCDGLHGLSDML